MKNKVLGKRLLAALAMAWATGVGVADAATKEIALEAGWNLVNTPLEPTTPAVDTVLGGISGTYATAWAWDADAKNWQVRLASEVGNDIGTFATSKGFLGLTELHAGQGVWLKMQAAATLTITGTAPAANPPVGPVVNGWNLIGSRTDAVKSVAEVVTALGDEVKPQSLWQWQGGNWAVALPFTADGSAVVDGGASYAASKGFPLLTALPASAGFWVNALAASAAPGASLVITDTAGAPVVGATVYAIPAGDVENLAGQPLTMTNGVYSAEALNVDEPLEDLINGNYTPPGSGVTTYPQAVTGSDGKAKIVDLPTGVADKFFIYVQPAAEDAGRLPGGSLCREAVAGALLDETVTAVKVSTKPSATATFVGSSSCLGCHADKAGMTKTAHKLGFMSPGAPSNLQDTSEFDADNGVYNLGAALAKYGDGDASSGGTTIWFYDYDSTRKFDKFKTLESAPASGTVYATVRIYHDTTDGKYYAQFTNVINPADANSPKTQEVVLTYGGGVYKQRPITKVDDSLFMIPLQYNAKGSDASTDRTRKVWRDYHMDWWWNAADNTFKNKPAANNSVDVQCAPCHFNGYQVATINGYYQATGVADANGEIHPATGEQQELNIGCETCHGPGSEHVAASGAGKSIVTPQNLTPERATMICGQCHSRPQGNDSLGVHKDSPLDQNNRMMVAGTKRADFLANNTSRHDASASAGDLWGDGLHSKSHHQQYTDFIQTAKYRNGGKLLTCASCHDLHGPGSDRHQLSGTSDNTLCASCHGEVVLADHQVAKTGANMGAATKCIDCHVTKTSSSGAGSNPTSPTVGGTSGTKYYQGDISSHRFDVPSKAATSSTNPMPVPYTNNCGLCHNLSTM